MPARFHVREFLEFFAPAFAQGDQEKLHYPARTELPLAGDRLVFIVDFAATDQALSVARSTIIQPTPSASVSLVDELDVMISEKRLDAISPGASVVLFYVLMAVVNPPAQLAKVHGSVLGEELRHTLRVTSQDALSVCISERLDLLATPELFDFLLETLFHTVLPENVPAAWAARLYQRET